MAEHSPLSAPVRASGAQELALKSAYIEGFNTARETDGESAFEAWLHSAAKLDAAVRASGAPTLHELAESLRQKAEAEETRSPAVRASGEPQKLESAVEQALRDLLGVIAADDLIPESVSYMRQARAALAKSQPQGQGCPICDRPLLDAKNRPTACARGYCPNLADRVRDSGEQKSAPSDDGARQPQEKIRAALEKVLRSAVPHPVEHPAMFAAWAEARSLLALLDTPAAASDGAAR